MRAAHMLEMGPQGGQAGLMFREVWGAWQGDQVPHGRHGTAAVYQVDCEPFNTPVSSVAALVCAQGPDCGPEIDYIWSWLLG
jgi:hypothetical protein